VTLPFFGWQGGITAAVVTFLMALTICWGICLFPKNLTEVKPNVDRSRLRQAHQAPARPHRD
jgi:hypothetical protein